MDGPREQPASSGEPRGRPADLACRLTGSDFGARRAALDRLRSGASTVRELADGFQIRFDPDGVSAREIVAFVEEERVCCPFLRFAIEFEPDGGPIRLRITGPEGAKAFLATELALADG